MKFRIILIGIILTLFFQNITAEKDIFDAVAILEYLSGDKIFNESEISIFDVDCDCNITLNDALIIIQNNALYENTICTTICNRTHNKANITCIMDLTTIIEKIIKENEKIKSYKYNGNFTGNASNVKINGTASGNYTFILTIPFDNIPFNATLNLTSYGIYNGTYNRTNNNGFIDGNMTTRINGTITTNIFGNIEKQIDETNTTEIHNQTDIDIYNISINVLKDNATKINFSEDVIDNISCYKIIAIPDKTKGIEIIKSIIGNSEIGMNLLELNFDESIKYVNITYWIEKQNFSIIQEKLSVEIENFEQKINKTIEINKCKDSLCIKNAAIDTIYISNSIIDSYVKFYEIIS